MTYIVSGEALNSIHAYKVNQINQKVSSLFVAPEKQFTAHCSSFKRSFVQLSMSLTCLIFKLRGGVWPYLKKSRCGKCPPPTLPICLRASPLSISDVGHAGRGWMMNRFPCRSFRRCFPRRGSRSVGASLTTPASEPQIRLREPPADISHEILSAAPVVTLRGSISYGGFMAVTAKARKPRYTSFSLIFIPLSHLCGSSRSSLRFYWILCRRKAVAVMRKVAEGLRFDCGQCSSFTVFTAAYLRFPTVLCGCRTV